VLRLPCCRAVDAWERLILGQGINLWGVFLQGEKRRFWGGVPLRKNFWLCSILFCVLIFAGGGAAAYPDTAICATTPTIDFPTNVTLGKDFLLLTSCSTPDFNGGDFVSIWIEDTDNSPIISVSNYAETETGIEWISPLSDNVGQAWERLPIAPELFDCNSTGVPYSVEVNWDSNPASKTFNVFCPNIELIKYRNHVSYWETLKVEAQVKDIRGYTMKNIPCRSKVLDIGRDANASAITIKQEYKEVFTDNSGRASFEYSTGMLDNLLQGYTYTVEVTCLGADANFVFVVGEQESEYLRNPLYFFVVYVADNFVPILAAFIFGLIAIAAVYAILLREKNE